MEWSARWNLVSVWATSAQRTGKQQRSRAIQVRSFGGEMQAKLAAEANGAAALSMGTKDGRSLTEGLTARLQARGCAAERRKPAAHRLSVLG